MFSFLQEHLVQFFVRATSGLAPGKEPSLFVWSFFCRLTFNTWISAICSRQRYTLTWRTLLHIALLCIGRGQLQNTLTSITIELSSPGPSPSPSPKCGPRADTKITWRNGSILPRLQENVSTVYFLLKVVDNHTLINEVAFIFIITRQQIRPGHLKNCLVKS